MKKIIIALLCAAALTACSDNNTAPETSEEATTAVTTEAATAVETTTAAEPSTTITATTTVAPRSFPEEDEILSATLGDRKFGKVTRYNGLNVEPVTEELDWESQQKLFKYLEDHEFEQIKHYPGFNPSLVGNVETGGQLSEERHTIDIRLLNKDDLPLTADLCADLVFSEDRQYFALVFGQAYYVYKLTAPEELDFLYELAGV